MKKILIITFYLVHFISYSQGEANFWYFGSNAGLDFEGGNPRAINGSLNTIEGCSSFSDKNGNLLFYSDGINVWDKTHSLMPNGTNLKGNPSSSQSAIIVPNPANINQYYIFTVGANHRDSNNQYVATEGLNCYTIDIALNNGLGDIYGSAIDLSDGRNAEWTEKVAAVKGADCNTFWVISLVGKTFYSYKIDDSIGLNTIPIKSTVNYQSIDRRGYLKVSPDGQKLASATYTQFYNMDGENILGEGKLHLYSFNDITGEVLNNGVELISNAAIDGSPYGVEFSSESTKLYCTTFDGNNNKLIQFDLENTDVVSTKYLIKSQIGYRGAIQLAPNGKIYATVPPNYDNGTHFLDAINAPEELGLNCNYQTEALNLGTGYAMQGLPPFIASLLLPIEITSVEENNEIITNKTLKLCVGSDYTFNAENLPGSPSYSWTIEGVEKSDTPSLSFTNIQLNEAGVYELEVNLIDDCGFPIIYKGFFEIETYIPPTISTTLIYNQCDIDEDSTDGTTLFNLTNKIEEITNNDPNTEVSFYESQVNLDNNTHIMAPSEYISTNNMQIFIKVVNTKSGCYTTGELVLNVFATSLDSYKNMYSCEIDLANNNDLKSYGNGESSFNFEDKRQEIQALFVDPNTEVSFYENTTDAQLQINSLAGILNYPNKEIIVKISNKISNNCISVGKLNLIVNPIPLPEGTTQEIILCVNNPKDNPQLFTTLLNGQTTVSGDTYQWYFNNEIIKGATNFSYDANAEGIYKIEVTRFYENDINDSSDTTFCSGFNTFKVIESNQAVINYDAVKVIDDSQNNSISISTNNLGQGDYEFSLDDEFLNFQDEPYFENVSAGIHTIFVQDKNNCGTSKIDVSVIGYPKFFTPNNDGYNDTWQVLGVNENFYSNSNIFIFDRYGKLITQIDPKGEGWNGMFNGNYLPSTDYWFSVELIDKLGNIRMKKGHFSLIRR